MSRDRFDAVLASTPLDSVTARVVGGGEHYEPRLKRSDGSGTPDEWDAPPPMMPPPNTPELPNLIGRKFGRLTVIGFMGAKRPGQAARWAVRCVCGTYTHRRTAVIRNPANNEDACWECRHLQRIQRRYEQLGPRPIGEFTK